MSEEEKTACQRYINNHPNCTVGEVIAKVFDEPANVLDQAMLTVTVVRYLLHLLKLADAKEKTDDR